MKDHINLYTLIDQEIGRAWDENPGLEDDGIFSFDNFSEEVYSELDAEIERLENLLSELVSSISGVAETMQEREYIQNYYDALEEDAYESKYDD